jgi:NADH dehydrogenase
MTMQTCRRGEDSARPEAICSGAEILDVGQSRRVVILGGGIAGIDIATHLAGRKTNMGRLNVTLVDREPAHIWKPMLHTIAAGTRDLSQQQTSYIAHARAHGFVFQPGEVTSIDRAAHRVRLAPLLSGTAEELIGERELTYDTLIVALGSRANDFGTPGVTEHCFTIDSRRQAIGFNDEVRNRIIMSLTRQMPLTIAIVGGGATGVELAAELVQLADLAEYYGAAGARKRIRLHLIESGERLLAAFPDYVAEAARARLEKLGVDIHVKARVAAGLSGISCAARHNG